MICPTCKGTGSVEDTKKDTRVFLNKNNAEYKAVIKGEICQFDYCSLNSVDEVFSVNPKLMFIGNTAEFVSKYGKTYRLPETNVFVVNS